MHPTTIQKDIQQIDTALQTLSHLSHSQHSILEYNPKEMEQRAAKIVNEYGLNQPPSGASIKVILETIKKELQIEASYRQNDSNSPNNFRP
mgnify:CR=1 FL=1